MNSEIIDRRIIRKKRRRRVFIALAIIFITAAAWIFRPYFHADESQIDPRLRALQKPYQIVYSSVIFDGGSSVVRIIDAVGRREVFFIPCDEPHPKVYVIEATNIRKGRVPASNHAATQQELVAIVSEHCDDIWGCFVLEHISGRLRDKLRTKLWHGWDVVTDWWKGL